MIIFKTPDGNNKVIMNLITPERLAEMEDLLFIPQDITNPEPRLMRCYPASFYTQFTHEEVLNFAMRYGIYQFPTNELINFLKNELDLSSTIEIAAGGGHVGKHLPGVIQSDSKLQEQEWVKKWYKENGQYTIQYPSWMAKLDAELAVQIYKPKHVLGCWTVEAESSTSGEGVSEVAIASKVEKYVIVGNNHLHKRKPVLTVAHAYGKLRTIYPEWMISKASIPSQNCIYIIDKLR